MVVQEIIQRLHKNGYEVFYVGGYIRDKLLGIPCKDIDLATNCTPEQLEVLFPDKKINSVGKSFLVTIISNIEVATYRLDRKSGLPTHADSIYEDLSRRDLTINAIAQNAVTGEIVDPYNGRQDLIDKIIRFVGNPYERLTEDYDRLLRATRFLATLEGSFSVETLQALKDCAHHVKCIAPERIRIEILKAMSVKTPSIFFSALHLIGALKSIFPALDDCVGHTGGKHHGEDLFTHCMEAGNKISPRFKLLRLAAFLHDIGKAETWDENEDTFIEHESVGGRLVKQYLKNLKFSNEEVFTVSNLIFAHMRVARSLTPKGTRRLQKYLADYAVNPRDFLRLKLADRQANFRNGPNSIGPIKELILKIGIRGNSVLLPLTVRSLSISGGQLIEEFNLKPSPIIGELQKSLLEYVINEGEEVNTYELLKAYAENLLNVRK